VDHTESSGAGAAAPPRDPYGGVMAQFERSPRADPGGPASVDGAPPKVTMALGPDGRFHAVAPPRDLTAETEERPAPPTAGDPRSAFERNLPPYAAGG
jgi:hypothetical protein